MTRPMPADTAPGRNSALHCRYSPAVFAAAPPPALAGLEVLYVGGGLQGNTWALGRVRDLSERECGRIRHGPSYRVAEALRRRVARRNAWMASTARLG